MSFLDGQYSMYIVNINARRLMHSEGNRSSHLETTHTLCVSSNFGWSNLYFFPVVNVTMSIISFSEL